MAIVSTKQSVISRVALLLLLTWLAPLAEGTAAVVVVEQPAGQPPFEAVAASFGPRLTCEGVTGELAEADFPAKTVLADACAPLPFPVTGKILIVDRANCFFDTKVGHAQDAGASAVIVVNNQSGPAVGMRSSPGGPKITIPAVMLSQEDGAALRAIKGHVGAVVRLRTAPCGPARVVATRMPDGMLQVSGAGEGSTDRFVLTNLGDEPTEVSLTGSGSFFAFEPSSVFLPSRGSQTVSITASAAAQGLYDGTIAVSGAAVPDGILEVPVRLAVESRPAATPGAVAAAPRIDVVGTERTQTASVTFENSGTGAVRGLLVSDAPWVKTPGERIEVPPGEARGFSFSIDRALRVEGGQASGSSAALLRLVHLDAAASTSGGTVVFGDEPLLAPVIVVDTVKPETTSTAVPQMGNGEVAIFLPGVGSVTETGGAFISNLSIVNTSRTTAVDDVRAFFLADGNDPESFSHSLETLQSLNLSDVVTNAFDRGEQVGTLQIRSASSDRLGVSATVVNKTNASGVYGTAIPAFRSDQSVGPFESATLAGIAKDGTTSTSLYIQETSGLPSAYRIEFFDEAGAAIGQLEESVGAFALSVVGQDRMPEGAVSALVSNHGSGRLASYAKLTDRASGDSWVVADWNRFYGTPYFGRQTIIPIAGAVSGRNDTYFTTDVVVTNVGSTEAPVTLEYWAPFGAPQVSRSFELAPRESRVMRDVVTTLFGVPAPSVGYILVRPGGGSTTTTSRTYTTAPGEGGTFGTGVPAVPYTVALAPGAARVFSGLADSTRATVDARTGGTSRTNVGLLEVQGSTAYVRVSLFFSDGKPLSAAEARASREYTLGPYELLQLNAIAAELLGPDVREASYGNLDNLVLLIENVGDGLGWVLPYVTRTDNGTGDTTLRIE
jgi:hypothetical protein